MELREVTQARIFEKEAEKFEVQKLRQLGGKAHRAVRRARPEPQDHALEHVGLSCHG